MEERTYLLREALGVLFYPLMFFIVAFCFVIAGFIHKEEASIFNAIALVSLIAGMINLFITWLMTKAIRRRR
jgi:uncharacterized membrane protein